ncbi:hypothetical protein AOLI_G00251650 [Acnodon oligacanthus]
MSVALWCTVPAACAVVLHTKRSPGNMFAERQMTSESLMDVLGDVAHTGMAPFGLLSSSRPVRNWLGEAISESRILVSKSNVSARAEAASYQDFKAFRTRRHKASGAPS